MQRPRKEKILTFENLWNQQLPIPIKGQTDVLLLYDQLINQLKVAALLCIAQFLHLFGLAEDIFSPL